MSDQDVTDLKVLIERLTGQIKNIFDVVTALKNTQERDHEKAEEDATRITRIEETIKNHETRIVDNFKDHKYFWDTQEKMQTYEGMGKVIKFLFAANIFQVIAFIFAAITMYIKLRGV